MTNIVTFKDEQLELEVNISPEEDTVWLTQAQMVDLFSRDQSVIARHIRNIFKERELDEKKQYAFFAYCKFRQTCKNVFFRCHYLRWLPCKITSWRSFPQVGNQYP